MIRLFLTLLALMSGLAAASGPVAAVPTGRAQAEIGVVIASRGDTRSPVHRTQLAAGRAAATPGRIRLAAITIVPLGLPLLTTRIGVDRAHR